MFVLRRMTGCRFACIGCPWLGPAHEGGAHEAQCAHPHKSAAEVVSVLAERDKRNREATVIYNQVLELLSYEKITFNGKFISRLVNIPHNPIHSQMKSIHRT